MTATATNQLCGEQVRCATYSVYVRNRRTGQPIEGCDFTRQPAEGQWTRKQHRSDDPTPSTAQVELNTSGLAPGCCECFPVPWRDELVIERLDRSGNFEDIAWIGPIWNVIDDSVFGTLQIFAKDRTVWPLERQGNLTEEIILTDVDESDVFMAVWNQLDAADPSGLVPRPVPTGNLVSVHFPAKMSVEEVWTRIPNVFWSVEGERMWGPGPVDLGFGESPVATLDVTSHWEEQGAVVDYNGRNTATCVTVCNQSVPTAIEPGAEETEEDLPPRNASGQFVAVDDIETEEVTTESNAPLIEATFPSPCVPHPDFGLHRRVVVDESIESEAEARQLAYEIYASDYDGDAFLVTSAGSLGRDAPVAVCDLLVGRSFLAVADSACVPLTQTLRLNNLVTDFYAEETGRGVRLIEGRVATDLQPLSNTRTSESRQSI